MTIRIFLHGLDSSGSGTKGSFFSARYPDMRRPDFAGSLQERMKALKTLVDGSDDLILVGSSFGGLMAACLATELPEQVKRLVLLAPALNFYEYRLPERKLGMDTHLVIGKDDTVTPPELVIPAAEATFSKLQIKLVDDDHLLHNTFENLDWDKLLS